MRFYRDTICGCINRDHVSTICHVHSISSLFYYFLIDARMHRLRLETKPLVKSNSLVPSTSDKFILTSYLFPNKYRFPGAAAQADLDIIALLRKSRHIACLSFFLFVLSTRFFFAKGSVSDQREKGTEYPR